EAELLLGHVLGVDRVGLVVQSLRPRGPEELVRYLACIGRRRGGGPIAYLLGHREFFGLQFEVADPVLVPRPDTELLVEEALDRTSHRALFGRALDLCTGSGCVAISFAKSRPTWQVTGTDISPGALEVARRNALSHGALWGISFLLGDLTTALPPGARFEIVLANPPYIPSSEVDTLEPDVKDHEPRGALDGGADGLDFYRRLAQEVPAHLVPGGVLALEVGAGQAAVVERLLEAAGFEDRRRLVDFAGHERVVSGKKGR